MEEALVAGDTALVETEIPDARDKLCANDELRLLSECRAAQLAGDLPTAGVVIGELIAIAREGRVPMVLFPGQIGSAGVAARTTVDLRGPHIGCPVVLMFEAGDVTKPMIMGVLRENVVWPLNQQPGQVEVDADGERMIVNAKEQIVLRCGKASITLTKSGKVVIKGAYIASQSSGVNRVKGGSIELN